MRHAHIALAALALISLTGCPADPEPSPEDAGSDATSADASGDAAADASDPGLADVSPDADAGEVLAIGNEPGPVSYTHLTLPTIYSV